LLGRVDVEAGALSEVPGAVGRGRNVGPDTSPCGLVSGATKISPCCAQAARYSPFSVTLECVQVRPDRYQTTGKFAPSSACGGRKIEKVMPVAVALDAWRITSCRPPCDLFSLRISIAQSDRHCERSEAIQKPPRSWIASSLCSSQ
jgi:hypothetical protein